MFILVKIVSALVYPAGISFALLVAGLACVRWGRDDKVRTRGLRIALAGLAVLYVFSNGLVANALTRSLERWVMAPDPLPRADGVIVLGGGIMPGTFPRRTAEVSEAGDRLLYAAHLLREQDAGWLFLAAGQGELATSHQTEAEAMVELLTAMQVDPARLILDKKSRTTRENAAEILPLARDRGARAVYLVTSANHMPRSLGVFRKQAAQLGITDLEIVPAPCDYLVIEPEKYPPLIYRIATAIIPQAGALEISTRMIHEYYGMAYYWLRGWI